MFCVETIKGLLQICGAEICAVVVPLLVVLAVSLVMNMVLWMRLGKMQVAAEEGATELIPRLSQDLHLGQFLAGRIYSYKVDCEMQQ